MTGSRALPVSTKAARAINRALEGLSAEDRLDALAIAFPQEDPTTRHARYRLALEAGITVLNHVGSQSAGRIAVLRVLEKGLA
jgi:hypothetical protein